tara:strand:+ start:49 stop:174 length:126 start_codon:yes stop_codon:yes gene_type:complete
MFDGTVIEKPEENIFQKKFVLDGSNFAIVQVDGKCGPPLIW